eukprot:gb/GFBE01027197.1/.p1 GENE.gb/GFBE01027197.1/~~gb/GFBE01027197.1/.p1  ORF type:complete len:365 (+),score=75.48 gb/GFBE01027197.1/:1-1095(+)
MVKSTPAPDGGRLPASPCAATTVPCTKKDGNTATKSKTPSLRETAAPTKELASTLRAVASPAAAESLSDGVQLSSGAVMPVVGYGTYKLKKGTAREPVAEALKCGYRLIDTAQVYDNEADVGAAIKASGLPRGDVFVETKVWRSSHGRERTLKAFNQSLKRLGLSYIDLYVIHWPGPKTGWPLKKGTVCPPDWTPALRDEGTWQAMEELYEQGKVRALGVTNYSLRQLKQLLAVCKVRPAVNQVEFHPRLVQSEMLEFCRSEGIVLQAYASLGSGDAAQAEDFFELPPVKAAAAAHGAKPAQVLLRWALQKGCLVIPKSTRPERMAENAGIFSFSLTEVEMQAIDALHTGTRFAWKGVDPDTEE